MSRRDTLYSAKTEIDRHGTERVRISKFIDGELESSYLTTLYDCECPAGVRPSCRHRQMLPQMQAHRIVNTHWFWNFDLNRVVDFSGMLKSNLDALNELAAERDARNYELDQPFVPEQRTQSVTEQPQPPMTTRPSWRRL